MSANACPAVSSWSNKAFFRTTIFFMLLIVAGAAFADAPWRRRRRGDSTPNRRAAQLVTIDDFSDEPESPPTEEIDEARFASALRTLCGWMPPTRPERWTGYLLSAAREFEVDPFLLAALSFRMGRCRHDAEPLNGFGLTGISRDMYAGNIRRGVLSYQISRSAGWEERTLDVSRFPFSGPQLLRPEPNFYFAAAILRMWEDQCATADEHFEQVPHRHYVSHFIWGDRVRSHRGEDRVLVDRRRMLTYYGAIDPPEAIEVDGIRWVSPLDGAPRVISSWLGAERDDGARSHRGIDVESALGEPVRAVARGRVNFAGVDLPGHRNSESMRRSEIEAVPRDELGAGGRYVCVLHRTAPNDEGEQSWRRSCYMHLEDVLVDHGDEVEAGDIIGTVGRTGMRRSAPHLHLELHGPDGLGDASQTLSAFLIGRPPED